MGKILKFIATDILPLAIILGLVYALAIAPYNGLKAQNVAHRRLEIYQCQLNPLLKRFMRRAILTRTITAKSQGVPEKVRKVNHKTAKIYSQILRQVEALGPEDCSQVLPKTRRVK